MSTPSFRFSDLHLDPGKLLICLDQLSLPKCIQHVLRQLNSVSLAYLCYFYITHAHSTPPREILQNNKSNESFLIKLAKVLPRTQCTRVLYKYVYPVNLTFPPLSVRGVRMTKKLKKWLNYFIQYLFLWLLFFLCSFRRVITTLFISPSRYPRVSYVGPCLQGGKAEGWNCKRGHIL